MNGCEPLRREQARSDRDDKRSAGLCEPRATLVAERPTHDRLYPALVKLPAGKLPPDLLRRLLASLPSNDASVVVGGAVGEDAAVLDTGAHELLVVKTDPITFVAEDVGRYLLAVNGNDLATMGAEPRWLLVTALLPEGIESGRAQQIFEDVAAACRKTGVSLVGGHTEITVGLDRPMLVGCLLGTVARDRLVRTSGAKPGDAVLLAGGIAIEGTAILANEHAAALQDVGVDPAIIESASGWLRSPGISVVSAAKALQAAVKVHSMHDPTEGGLATALHELAEAAGVGLRIDRSAIAVLPECEVICQALGLDPLGLLASGALLATVDERDAGAALESLQVAEIPGVGIGKVLSADAGLTLVSDEREASIPTYSRDELARFLAVN